MENQSSKIPFMKCEKNHPLNFLMMHRVKWFIDICRIGLNGTFSLAAGGYLWEERVDENHLWWNNTWQNTCSNISFMCSYSRRLSCISNDREYSHRWSFIISFIIAFSMKSLVFSDYHFYRVLLTFIHFIKYSLIFIDLNTITKMKIFLKNSQVEQ